MALYLTSEGDIKTEGNLDKVPDSVVTPRMAEASRIVARHIGSVYYETVLAMDADNPIKMACVQAESKIGAAKLLLVIAHDSSGRGVVGKSVLGEGHSEFLDYASIKARHNDFMRDAMVILEPYLYDPDSADADTTDDTNVQFPQGSMWVV